MMQPSPSHNAAPQLTVIQLQAMLTLSEPPVLLDVREESEREICQLPSNVHIPLGQLVQRAAELPHDQPIVVYCHHGGRSARAVQWLREQGFDATNLSGGIDAWAVQIDPAMQRY